MGTKEKQADISKRTLTITMLGGFSIVYEGKEIVPGRNTTSKFIQLLQIIWTKGDEGITRQQLIDDLYGEEDSANISNSFNNLIYQMRKQMVRAGLPVADYVHKQQRMYYPDPEINVIVDVQEFEQTVARAEAASDENLKQNLYERAMEIYKGQYLPHLQNESWVIVKGVALQNKFDKVVNWLGNFYMGRKNFPDAYRVYEKAAKIYPESEYQIGQMQSLVARGKYKEAFQLYDQVSKFYSQELGIPVSPAMIECYKSMGQQIDNGQNHIVDIQKQVLEDERASKNKEDGAYGCSYPSFIDAYHILSRNMERTGYSVYMMLCTIVDYEGKPITNKEKLNGRAEALGQAIQDTLRSGDTFTRYGSSQFLILLVGTSQEDCDIIYSRISHRLKEIAGSRAEFKFSTVSLADLPSDLGQE